ncbi:MAG: LytTR family transcriptional regulator DNA-binding domain-containing protein [Lachnospiraceae bacterium]|nr:LytTR family transcriptional regulator DNA-binding domain-containing protein [Lachnospiraceae bacterium]
MRITIEKIQEKEKEEALLRITEMTADVQTAISILESGEQVLLGLKGSERVPCPISKIYYIESVDEKTFLYTKTECLEVKYKLYELESILDQRFFRCSKSMICNMRKIRSIKTGDNSRLNATLLNGESLIITRSYVPEFKKRLGL